MGFFRSIFGLTSRTETVRDEIEAELVGIRDDIREARRRQRLDWGLDAEPEQVQRGTNGRALKSRSAK